MGRHRQHRPRFTMGDFVFAKMIGYRPWPARVLALHGTSSKTRYNVFFYGTCNTAKVSPAHIFDYEANKRRLGAVHSRNTARNAGFRSAMAHIRRAFERPEHDFVYYQVLARTNGDDEISVTYDTLSSADSDVDSVDSIETHQSTAKERDSEETDDEMKAELISEDGMEAQSAETSIPLQDDQDDAPEQAQSFSAMERELQRLDGDEDFFGAEDSKSFEFEDNPLNIELDDSDNVENLALSLEEQLEKMTDGDEGSEFLENQNEEDEDSENDLSYNHITGDEYPITAT